MNKAALFTFVVTGSLLGASMAHANGSSSACMATPGAAGPVISAELSGIAALAGDARRSALDAYVLDVAGTKYTSAAGTACAATAISQAAQLYPSLEDQKRVADIASSLGTPDIETAAIGNNPDGTGNFDGPRGSNN